MRFHHSLRFKITLAFVTLMIVGNSTSIYLANRNVSEKYASYINQSDRQKAYMAALFLADRWEEFQNDQNRLPRLQEQIQIPRSGMGRNMTGEKGDPVPFIVTDEIGTILLSPGPPEKPGETLEHFSKGVPVYVNEKVKAYVLAGSMIDHELSRIDKTMLNNINRVLIVTNIISTLAILALGIVLLGRVLSPLEKIERAAADLGRGRYSVRTKVSGKDEIGRLGFHFDEMARSLEASEEWKRRIIADTAHELRTPVSLVLSRLEMIKDGIYPADESQLNTLYREVEHFSRLIREMQKLAGMEGGTRTLEKGAAALSPFCVGQIRSFLPESHKKEITLLWNGEIVTDTFLPTFPNGEEDRLEADWNKLEQVLKNLLSNALRHTPEKGTVELHIEKTSTDFRIRVADSGPGIPPGERARIFDRFYRLDGARNREHGGSGLGLAISKAIVEAHGGTISAGESSLGGAEFQVKLPR
jgi:signal transduction histidine kinase